jgi:hypothetical protein
MQTHWQFYSSGAVKIGALPRDAIQITEAGMKLLHAYHVLQLCTLRQSI